MTRRESEVNGAKKEAKAAMAAAPASTKGSISVVLEASFDGLRWKRTGAPGIAAALRRDAWAALKQQRSHDHGR